MTSQVFICEFLLLGNLNSRKLFIVLLMSLDFDDPNIPIMKRM